MDASQTVELSLQLGVSAALVLAMSVLHSLGLVAISRLLPLGRGRPSDRHFNARSSWLLGALGLLLFMLHIAEIWLFAGLYLAIGAMRSLEEALYYSAAAYATLGRTADYSPDEWRLLGAVEALIGFILISWPTAFMATTMNRLRR